VFDKFLKSEGDVMRTALLLLLLAGCGPTQSTQNELAPGEVADALSPQPNGGSTLRMGQYLYPQGGVLTLSPETASTGTYDDDFGACDSGHSPVCAGTFTLTKDESDHYIRIHDEAYDQYARFRYTVSGAERQKLTLTAVSGGAVENYAGTIELENANRSQVGETCVDTASCVSGSTCSSEKICAAQ
jgi:hypothetical protein